MANKGGLRAIAGRPFLICYTSPMNRTLLILAGVVVVALVAFYGLKVAAPETSADLYEGWSEVSANGLTFRYPDPFPGSYVSAATWPPEVERTAGYACDEGTNQFFHTEEKVINGTTYCLSKVSEGAAGSTYIDYEYAKEGIKVSFSLRFPQCANYDKPQQDECLVEQDTFESDTLADRILSSVH